MAESVQYATSVNFVVTKLVSSDDAPPPAIKPPLPLAHTIGPPAPGFGRFGNFVSSSCRKVSAVAVTPLLTTVAAVCVPVFVVAVGVGVLEVQEVKRLKIQTHAID